MAVDAVSSSGNVAASTQLRARQAEPDDQARKVENDRARVEREAAERSRVQNAREDQAQSAKPTVNAEGQQVGTRINITA